MSKIGNALTLGWVTVGAMLVGCSGNVYEDRDVQGYQRPVGGNAVQITEGARLGNESPSKSDQHGDNGPVDQTLGGDVQLVDPGRGCTLDNNCIDCNDVCDICDCAGGTGVIPECDPCL